VWSTTYRGAGSWQDSHRWGAAHHGVWCLQSWHAEALSSARGASHLWSLGWSTLFLYNLVGYYNLFFIVNIACDFNDVSYKLPIYCAKARDRYKCIIIEKLN
jgi:hypothetical protein